MNGLDERILTELENRVKSKQFKLNSLLEITRAINSNKPIHELLEIYKYILVEQLGIRQFVLFNQINGWEVLCKVGLKGKIRDIDAAKDFQRIRDITVIESSHKKSLSQFDVVVPVHHRDKPLAFLVLGGMPRSRNDFENAPVHLNFIQTLTNIIVVAIENRRMAHENMQQELVKRDLKVAEEMQKMLFPGELPSNNRIDISAKYRSHSSVGGDYYDYIPLNENEFVVCIGDVSGKGVSAAMLMANFQATVRTFFKFGQPQLKELVVQLNEHVFSNARGEKFITFFIAEYNAETRVLKYVNAGHNYPLLVRGKTSQFLSIGCIGLGMMQNLPFIEQGELQILPNTTLILYTDGVVELENETNEQFETERLTKIVQNFYPLSMEDLNQVIFGKLEDWKGMRSYLDDTAIVSCRIF